MNAQSKVTAGVHRKLSTARQKFHGLKLTKTGKNTFAGYNYFELGDFLVPALQVFDEVGLGATISFTADTATMTIVDLDAPENTIVITSPMGSAALKGCHEVQNIGAVETYQRRYLWVAALEIVEHDALDATTGKADTANDTSPGPAPRVKLDGPHTSKTALKGAVNGIMNAVRKVADKDALNEILKKESNKATIAQAERDWPELITGDPKIEGDGGLRGYVQRKREELAGSVGFQLLMSLIEEADTPAALQNVINVHGDAIDALEDGERRKFEARFEEREAGLMAVATVAAG